MEELKSLYRQWNGMEWLTMVVINTEGKSESERERDHEKECKIEKLFEIYFSIKIFKALQKKTKKIRCE